MKVDRESIYCVRPDLDFFFFFFRIAVLFRRCLLYTSDAADDMQCVDLGGRRIIKKTLHSVPPRHSRSLQLGPRDSFFKQKTAYEM